MQTTGILWNGFLQFGPHPSNQQLLQLMNKGYSHFIDLSEECAYIGPHTVNNKHSSNKAFSELLIRHVIIMRSCNEKVYVHCKDGSRSALFCACVLVVDMDSALLHNSMLLTGNVLSSIQQTFYPNCGTRGSDIAEYALKMVYKTQPPTLATKEAVHKLTRRMRVL